MASTEHLDQYKIKPGEIRNPYGNAEGHSTKSIKSRIQHYLDNPVGDIAHKFASKNARDALIETLLDKSLNDKDAVSIKILIEHSEGKPNQAIDVTSKGKSVKPASSDRLDEMLTRLGKLEAK